jgi:membrane peptidoglycan carboxypeptidase
LLGALVIAVAGTAAFGVLSRDLPDPARLAELTFDQPTIVYDRTGKVELGRFQREARRVVTFDEIPRLVLDATTVAEDRTFWMNEGYDPAAIVSAALGSINGGERGASTITQQLVRARLLPADVLAGNQYVRKVKEIIQAARLTSAFPGEAGKRDIITAYLNEIFYGHEAYGVAAAAQIYFGVSDLSKLTPAQAALLAGLPKSPTSLDPYRFAKPDKDGHLVVPMDAPPVVRRNYIMQSFNSGARWTQLSDAQLRAALAEPVVLASTQPLVFKAPHFTWQVERQLEQILGGKDAVQTAGYSVITTLDMHGQDLAEKWLSAAVIAPNLTSTAASKLLRRLKVGSADSAWIANLRGKDVHNAALVALDYRTGDVLAYAGSAGYYEDKLASTRFNPKYDVAGDGSRQPGSAWKPVLYATAFEKRVLTPGSLLLDIATQFGPTWAPHDADQLERGPVLVRKALQYSLNIPAIRAIERVGDPAVARQAAAMGITFNGGAKTFIQGGLASAIGTVEVRPIDLTDAYGTLANAGVHVPTRMILEIRDNQGNVVYRAPDPGQSGKPALSAGSSWLVSDILAGNTDPSQNPIWSKVLAVRNGPGGSRRPAAAKTGTTSDARDLATYGFLPAPKDTAAPALAVGVWMGNSDHSKPRAKEAAISLQGPAPLWHAFVRDYTKGQPVASFPGPPKGVVRATIDKWTGGAPGSWTKGTIKEWFLDGTQPGARGAVDRPGLLYALVCGGWRVDPVAAELGPQAWDTDVANWMQRARRGPGVEGPLKTRTAYFWGEHSWGGLIDGPCVHVLRQRGGGGGHHKHGQHGVLAAAATRRRRRPRHPHRRRHLRPARGHGVDDRPSLPARGPGAESPPSCSAPSACAGRSRAPDLASVWPSLPAQSASRSSLRRCSSFCSSASCLRPGWNR